MSERETWATRIGFLLAAIGSAVGLGNIWQFPFKTATNGGAIFVLVYLVAVLVIGLPTLLAEFVVGRRTRANAVDAFEKLGYRNWRIVGALGAFIGFWIVSYYSVVGGWVGRYIIGSARGAYFDAPAEYFGAVSAGPDAILFHALFMAITVAVVAFGIEDGIEKATKVMVPSIVVLMIGLAIWAATLGGAADGYSYFLNPDFSQLAGNAGEIIPFAVSQAFFTLSLGMAIMITYSSYVDEDTSLFVDGGAIVVTNTLVGILAGLVVFPILFANNIEASTSGPAAIFVAMASAFSQVPGGRILGVAFFAVVLIAALSSAISLMEVIVSWATDHFAVSRPVVAGGIGTALFVLGLPSAWDTAWLTWFDNLAYKLLLPTSVLLLLIFVGYILGQNAISELAKGSSLRSVGPIWLWTIRTIVILSVIVTLVLGIETLLAGDFLGLEFIGEDPPLVPPF
ncbi:sodium-dependent transporter [Salinibaculum rarum]|uniref:sodium-dependent transporter n=1 Tax=Salinibaculum rarum TaxID=3058903 RepID=UPI00265EC55F|nr:sodium-dependent transporter [Salinibaculum sp. KK48]